MSEVNLPKLDERFELLKLDYDRTAKLLETLNSNTMTARGFAITVSGALVTVAVSQHTWFIALIAVVAVLLFFAIDLYYSATLKRAYEHLEHVDTIFRLYYESLGKDGSDTELVVLLNSPAVENDRTRFGLKGATRATWTIRDWIDVPLRFPLIALYGTLVLLALATLFLVRFTHVTAKSKTRQPPVSRTSSRANARGSPLGPTRHRADKRAHRDPNYVSVRFELHPPSGTF